MKLSDVIDMDNIIKIDVYNDNEDRLDLFLSEELEGITRSAIQKLIKSGNITVNNKVKKSSYLLKEGDRVLINIPEARPIEIFPEDIPIDILYEDNDLAIVNKVQGMVVHPAPGNYSGTLVNALLFHIGDLSMTNGLIRAGIVHRLDKDTSGLLIIAKNEITHYELTKQFKDRSVLKEYITLVHNNVKEDGKINKPIGRNPKNRKKMAVVQNGKEAITSYQVLKSYNKYTLLKIDLKTGRTHQIRVHMADINHPIVGDPVYSSGKNEFKIDKQLLHAFKIGFIHPKREEYMEFEKDVPEDFENIINKLNKRVII